MVVIIIVLVLFFIFFVISAGTSEKRRSDPLEIARAFFEKVGKPVKESLQGNGHRLSSPENGTTDLVVLWQEEQDNPHRLVSEIVRNTKRNCATLLNCTSSTKSAAPIIGRDKRSVGKQDVTSSRCFLLYSTRRC